MLSPPLLRQPPTLQFSLPHLGTQETLSLYLLIDIKQSPMYVTCAKLVQIVDNLFENYFRLLHPDQTHKNTEKMG